MEDISLVLITGPNEEQAAQLARTLLSEGLVACVNIIPQVRSIYRWEGKVEDQAETLCILKTAKKNVARLRTRVLELHPYDTPEFIEIEADSVSEKYAAWIFLSSGS